MTAAKRDAGNRVSPPTVLVDPPPVTRPEDWDRLRRSMVPVQIAGEEPVSEAQLIESLHGCQGLMRLGRRLPEVTARVLNAAPDLRVVGLKSDRFGTGIDVEAADARGIVLVDTDNISSAHAVAEWDLALILLCLRNAGAVFRQMISGTETWANAGNEGGVCGELAGRKVGLLGCGHVGRRLVELLAPFRVDLRVYDPYLPADMEARLRIQRDDLDGVLHHADILVIQVPLTPKTTRLIGERELNLLGRGKILINCSRGRVVDQEALLRKLRAGELIAGLDVFDPEPLERDSPLRALPNVFLSPHIAWYAPNVFYRTFQNTVAEFERFFRGEPLEYGLTRRMLDIRHGRI